MSLMSVGRGGRWDERTFRILFLIFCVFKSKSFQVLASKFLRISFRALSHKSPLPFCWQNCLIYVNCSQLHCCASHSARKSLDFHWTSCRIYVVISTAPSFHVLSKNILETELEAPNDIEIFSFFTSYHFINFLWLHLPSKLIHNCHI